MSETRVDRMALRSLIAKYGVTKESCGIWMVKIWHSESIPDVFLDQYREIRREEGGREWMIG